MADVNRGNRPDPANRPLSPFMIGPYYRPQITSITSILTRITGLGLIVPALLIIWWFIAAATGPEAFARANGLLTSWFGDVVMTLSTAALWYHFLSGLRHIWWDNMATGMDIETAEKLGYGLFIGTFVLTVLTVIIV